MAIKKSYIAINWIEANLYIPEGRDVGKPFKLAEFQKDIIRAIYDNKVKTRTAIISMPRKSAKSTLTAALMLLHLCGPFAVPNSTLLSSARSRDQAAILYTLAQKMVLQSPTLVPFVKFRETRKEMTCPELGTLYKAVSADAKTILGASPVFHACDEAGAVTAASDPLFDSIETAMMAQKEPLSIILSTQARDDRSLLSLLIDSALRDSKPEVVVKLYCAPPDADAFDPKTLEIAHPAWNEFVNQEELLRLQREAKLIPTAENSFRNFILNQRVAATSPFIAKGVWKSNNAAPSDWKGKRLYMGLDLSVSGDMSALVAVYRDEPDKGEELSPNHPLNVACWFWLPGQGLVERAQADRIEWDTWAKQGVLLTTPTAQIDYDFLAKKIWEISKEAEIAFIAFDRYNFRYFRKSLEKVGFTDRQIEAMFVEYGQGFVSMTHSMRVLEGYLLNNRLRHGANPILTMNMDNSRVVFDSTGNRKIEKSGKNQKIDGAISLLMAATMYDEYSGKANKPVSMYASGSLYG